jgi:hypothetical protein
MGNGCAGMSKFVDKLKHVSHGVQPMGFRAAATAPSKPRMLLVAVVPQVDTEHPADIVAGADAGLLSMARPGSGAKALEQMSQAVPDIPWGGWLKEIGKEGVGKVGGDFIVFPAEKAALAMPDDEERGKILEVEPWLEPGLLKAIDSLPVDAVLIAAEDKQFLTWHHLMLFQRCANILSKPLLVLVPPEVTSGELAALWEVGVRGVVVRAGVEGKIAGIRQMLDKLPVPSVDKRNKAGPLLPRVGGGTGAVSEEEEEEEEEE